MINNNLFLFKNSSLENFRSKKGETGICACKDKVMIMSKGTEMLLTKLLNNKMQKNEIHILFLYIPLFSITVNEKPLSVLVKKTEVDLLMNILP